MSAIKHVGFKNAQRDIAQKEGYSMKRAGAILASKTRKAARGAAGRRNSRLRRVKGY